MLSDGMRFVLETGHSPEHWGDGNGGFEMFLAVKVDSMSAAPLWADHRDEVLADWIPEHPGCRPWAWWKFEAPEARQVVRGTALLVCEPGWLVERWRHHFGVPSFVQVRPRGAALPLVESEAAYLTRLGLFALGERAECDEEAFAPEEVNPFHVTEEELDRLLVRGGHPR